LNNRIADFFIKRLIETEPSQETVDSNMARGKVIIQAGISDLPFLFGDSFTPCIVSMNVMVTGFRLEFCEQISSSILVDRNSHHDLISNANSFNNIIDALSADAVLMEGMELHKVRESATFWVVMGRAV